jgi:hypothetical protein
LALNFSRIGIIGKDGIFIQLSTCFAFGFDIFASVNSIQGGYESQSNPITKDLEEDIRKASLGSRVFDASYGEISHY